MIQQYRLLRPFLAVTRRIGVTRGLQWQNPLPVVVSRRKTTANGQKMGNTTFCGLHLAPYEYIIQSGGNQDFRGKLIEAFNYWLNIPEDKLKIILDTVNLLRNGTVLIDDIEDKSKLRRGLPVAHRIFGRASTINSANYIYLIALEEALRLDHPDAIKVFLEEFKAMHEGQALDIHWRDNYICPSEDDYKIMVTKKTGGLFSLAFRLMQLFSQNKSNFSPVLETFSTYIQIRNDFGNLKSEEYQVTKSYCEDLSEGKFSFPVIAGIRLDDTNQIRNIIRQRTNDDDIKQYCVQYLDKLGAFAYTTTVLIDLEESVEKLIEELGGNSRLTAIVEDLKPAYRLDSKKK